MSRPKIIVDWQRVDDMLKCQASGEIIAGLLGYSYDTLERACKREKKSSFADYSRQKQEAGKNVLRMRMMKAAMAGNTAVMIFLSKNWLGMTDKQENNNKQEIIFTRCYDTSEPPKLKND